MFSGCTSLTSINFSCVNIDSVTKASNLFYSCESLQSVDLNQLDLSNIRDFSSMFHNCKSLEYINLINYDETGLYESNIIKLDNNFPSNLVICFDKDKAPQLYNS